jgi:hypothetical protein
VYSWWGSRGRQQVALSTLLLFLCNISFHLICTAHSFILL